MSARLGEMLIKIGTLTRAQLDQVLNAQAIYGGRLGTNLVEMGMVSEAELARVLNEKLGAPCVEPSALNAIPRDLLARVPLELVERYRVLPVALEGKKLTLAMADPSDFRAIEEIGFVTGLVVVPRVCSELRLNISLERHFGIKRTMRYIPVEGGFRSRFAIDGDHADAGATGLPSKEKPARRSDRPKVTLKLLAEKFAGADGEADLVSSLLSYLECEFDKGVVLTMGPGNALGVKGTAGGSEIETLPGSLIPLDDAGQLQRVTRDGRFYLGELAAEGAAGTLLRAMGESSGSPALLMPLSVNGQVAAVICALDRQGRLGGGVFDLQRVAAMAELTLEMISLRKRIKSS